MSCLTHVSGEGDVLDQMVADGLVSLDFVVGLPAKQDKLAVGRAKASKGSADPMRQIKQDEKVDERYDEVFTPTVRLQIRPERDEVGFFLVGQIDGMGLS